MLHSYFIKVENFGQENFGESLVIRQIRQNILPPKFCLVRYLSSHDNHMIIECSHDAMSL